MSDKNIEDLLIDETSMEDRVKLLEELVGSLQVTQKHMMEAHNQIVKSLEEEFVPVLQSDHILMQRMWGVLNSVLATLKLKQIASIDEIKAIGLRYMQNLVQRGTHTKDHVSDLLNVIEASGIFNAKT